MARNKSGVPFAPRGLDRLVLCPKFDYYADDELIAVGKIGKTWGVRGHVTVRLHNADSELEWVADVIHLKGEGFPRAAVSVDDWQDKGGKLVARFEGIDNPQDARALTHLEVLAPFEDLPEAEEDEVYVHELVGMRVIDELRGDLGVIENVFFAGANDVWVVKGAEETLLPAIAQVVKSIDREAREVHVLFEME